MGGALATRICAACGFLLLTAFAPAAQTDPVLGHACEEASAGPFGAGRLLATLTPAGEISHYELLWEMQPRREGAWLTGRWSLGAPPAAPGDDGRISVHFATDDRDVGQVRIEIWRGGEHQLTDMGFHGDYSPVFRNGPGAPYAMSSETRWSEIRAMLIGIEAASVAVVRYRFLSVVEQDRLDAAIIDMPAAAVAAARDGLAARIADYRNLCRPFRASDGVQ